MRSADFYKGREQTYVKHFFLEKYLERVAFNILSFRRDFVYVDGFSGPWKSTNEDYEDTSFTIAINQLRKVRKALREGRNKEVRIRCYFNDNDPIAFEGLTSAVSSITDLEIRAACRNFEDVIPDIVEYVGGSFSLTFIDPTGWTGFGLAKIRPLLQLPGEIIVNFMFDHVNRFVTDPRPETAATFDPLFGEADWYSDVEALVSAGMSREDAILETYRERLRRAGAFTHVTSTRILKPISERSYFHLVYGTRHWKGLVEFRKVEKQTISEQENVRDTAKAAQKAGRTGQNDLFSATGIRTGPLSFEDERNKRLDLANRRLRAFLTEHDSAKYEEILAYLLEFPLIWESDVKAMLTQMKNEGEIEIPRLTGRERVPKYGYLIKWLG